jgi:hypothetical protein
MISIRSDNAAVKEILTLMAKKIIESGGFLHSGIEILCMDNIFTINSKLPADTNEKIIQIPNCCLPSVNDYTFRLKDKKIEIEGVKGGADKTQIEIMAMMLDIFSLTKFEEIYESTTFLDEIEKKSPTIFSFLKEKIPEIATKKDTCKLNNFFKTRIISYADNNDGQRDGVIMPFMDALNHHNNAFPYDNSNDSSGIGILLSRPIKNSDECYVCYGPLAPLETFLGMGFYDEGADFLQSISAKIYFHENMRMSIFHKYFPADPEFIHPAIKDIGNFVPSSQCIGGTDIQLGHLFIPRKNKSISMRRIIELNIAKYFPFKKDRLTMEKMIAHIEEELLRINKNFYREILDKCIHEDDVFFEPLFKVCKLSIKIIEDYEEFVKKQPLTHLVYN